jgi:hypothetical protein
MVTTLFFRFPKAQEGMPLEEVEPRCLPLSKKPRKNMQMMMLRTWLLPL